MENIIIHSIHNHNWYICAHIILIDLIFIDHFKRITNDDIICIEYRNPQPDWHNIEYMQIIYRNEVQYVNDDVFRTPLCTLVRLDWANQ